MVLQVAQNRNKYFLPLTHYRHVHWLQKLASMTLKWALPHLSYRTLNWALGSLKWTLGALKLHLGTHRLAPEALSLDPGTLLVALDTLEFTLWTLI